MFKGHAVLIVLDEDAGVEAVDSHVLDQSRPRPSMVEAEADVTLFLGVAGADGDVLDAARVIGMKTDTNGAGIASADVHREIA